MSGSSIVHEYPHLVKGTLLKRYKRFLADIKLTDGSIIVAHVPFTGSMLGICGKNCEVRLSEAPPGSKRKLKYTLEAVKLEANTWVGCNTMLANQVIKHIFLNKPKLLKAINPDITNHAVVPELTIGKSRFDFALKSPNTQKITDIIEVKTVTTSSNWWRIETSSESARDIPKVLPDKCPPECSESNQTNKVGLFPDGKTERALKHLLELENLAEKNIVHLVYFVSRNDIDTVEGSFVCDEAYSKEYQRVKMSGKVNIHYALLDFQLDDVENSRIILRKIYK
jgi:sugar fermentation stimulation protein A